MLVGSCFPDQPHELLDILRARCERRDQAHQYLVGPHSKVGRQAVGLPWMIARARLSQPSVDIARKLRWPRPAIPPDIRPRPNAVRADPPFDWRDAPA